MAIAFVQQCNHDAFNAGTTFTATFSGAQTASNLIVVHIWWEGAAALLGTTPVSDSKGNSYHIGVAATHSTAFGGASGVNMAVCYAYNIAAASAGANVVTVTFTSATAGPIDVGTGFIAVEYSGAASATNPFDVGTIATGTGTGNTATGSPITLAQSELVTVCLLALFGPNSTPGSGYVWQTDTADGTAGYEDRVAAPSGSNTPTAGTNNSGDLFLMSEAAFGPPGGGATPSGTIGTFDATLAPLGWFDVTDYAVGWLDVIEIPPPVSTPNLVQSVFPDRVYHPSLLTSDHLAFALSMAPERTSVMASVSYPERPTRPALPASALPFVTGVSPNPEGTQVLDWQPEFPDLVPRPVLDAAEQQTFSTSQQPERASPIASVSFPDRADHPSMLASEQMAATGSLQPIQPLTLGWSLSSFADRAPRPALPAASHEVFASAVAPERTSPIAWVYAPDRAVRPSVHAAQQWAVTEPPAFPERTSPAGASVFPDFAPRPSLGAPLQSASTELPPRPEEPVALSWQSYQPASTWRAWIPAAENPASVLGPPERTIPLAAFEFPARIDRPSLHSSQQAALAQTIVVVSSAAPTIGYTSFPDNALRSPLRAELHASFALASQPERTTPISAVSYPDRLDRRQVHSAQQVVVTSLPPTPERTATLADTDYPSRSDRPYLHAAQYPTFAEVIQVAAQPQPTIGYAAFPDIALRSPHRAELHPTLAFAPLPERTSLFASTSSPDRVERPSLHASRQSTLAQVIPVVAPAFPTIGYASFPDIAIRSAHRAELHSVLALAPQPERSSPLAWTYSPDRVDRPSVHASQQWATTELPAKPEQSAALDWQTLFPDRASRPWILSVEHPVTAFAPQPERTSTLATVVFSDRVDRPSVQASQQFAATNVSPKPEGAIPLDWQPTYPDRGTLARLLAASQSATAYVQVVTQAPPLVVAIFPDRVDRISAHAGQQQVAATGLSPKPEGTLPLDWQPAYPDRGSHPTIAASSHPTLALWPFPLPSAVPTFWSSDYPDRIDRPYLHAAQHPRVSFQQIIIVIRPSDGEVLSTSVQSRVVTSSLWLNASVRLPGVQPVSSLSPARKGPTSTAQTDGDVVTTSIQTRVE